MAEQIRSIQKAREKIESQRAALRRLREQCKASTETALKTAATMGSAFSVAYVEGRYGEKSQLFGVPASLVVGVGATVAGVTGVMGKDSEIVQALGDGALAAYVARLGFEMGEEAAAEAA